jgi:hypothetical protein
MARAGPQQQPVLGQLVPRSRDSSRLSKRETPSIQNGQHEQDASANKPTAIISGASIQGSGFIVKGKHGEAETSLRGQ